MDTEVLEKAETQQEGGSFKRSPAIKVRIADINQGAWKEKFLELRTGEQVSRARIMGTVATKFISEDGNFANITLDDSTDTVRAKTWDNIKILEKVKIGDIVDLIGKARIYNEEIYIVPEIVRKIEDPNFELLRRLELIKKYGPFNSSAKQEGKTENTGEEMDLKKQILTLIDESKEGVSYIQILEKTKAPQAEVEHVINDLLGGGLCYEPSPGVIKKI